MKLETLYEYIEKVGVLTFSTMCQGEVHSRSAHFNGFDEGGNPIFPPSFTLRLIGDVRFVPPEELIEAGTPYRCIPERCDDCSSCLQVCPVDAILESLVF